MAVCCPSACGRLASAAAFISIGIIQMIAGILLLRSEYASMLSGPDFWTAASNVAVGSLLGVSATTWKTINKTSRKYARRRNVLAALVGSAVILNATTAALLIIDEGNKLLSIYVLHSSDKSEILAYAYSSSVCCPIVCVVVAIAFLTGICFRRKPEYIKTLGFKTVLNGDEGPTYNWVYTPNLPKPDPEVLRAALSSESSSSETGSDSSTDLPIPIHLRSRSSISDCNQTQGYSSKNSFLQNSINRKERLDDFVSPTSTRAVRVSFANESSMKTPGRAVRVREHQLGSSIRSRNSYRSTPASMLRENTPSGSIHRSNNCLDGSSVYSPKSQSDGAVLSPHLNARTPIRFIKQNTSKIFKRNRNYVEGNQTLGYHTDVEDLTEFDGSCHEASSFVFRRPFQHPHPNVVRASTGDQIETVFEKSLELGDPCHEASGFQSKNHSHYPHQNISRTLSGDQKGTEFGEPTEFGDSCHEASCFQSKRRSQYLNPSVNRTSSDGRKETAFDESTEFCDSFHEDLGFQSRMKINSHNPHPNVCRTSTADHSKVHQELENLDNSAIPFDSGVNDVNFHDETLLESGHKRMSSLSMKNYSMEDWDKNSPAGADLSVLVRNSNFRKKLSSKLIPAVTPVISDGHRFYRTPNRMTARRDRLKPYSKSKGSYDKYSETGFSSFKAGRQVDEIDSTKRSNSVAISPMTSISEKPQDEDSFLPSTSTHTSGYVSASNVESEEESDLVSDQTRVASKRCPSSAHKLIADEIRERYRKRSEDSAERSREDNLYKFKKPDCESQAVSTDEFQAHQLQVV